MPERLLRTFIAVSVPNKVGKIQEMVKTIIPADQKGLKWVNPNSIHLTLKFNGPTPAEIIPEMNLALNKITRDFTPIKLLISNTGCFPGSGRPRVLWLGMAGAVNQLHLLVNRIHGAMEKFGFADESTKFNPHVTIGRIRYPQKKDIDISNFLNTSYEKINMVTDRIHFLSSELLPGGPVYSNLGTHYFSPKSDKE